MSKLSNKEFKENMRTRLQDDNYLTELTKRAFAQADNNKNGTIDIYELKKSMYDVCKGLGCSYPDENIIMEEFYKLDKDKNNKIDFFEFKEFVKRSMLIIINRIPD